MPRWLSLLALALCAGCSPQGGAGSSFTDSRIPPALGERFLPPQGWAWGLIQTGTEPPIRYGVAAPPVRPRGDVLILCGYGESAEAWFEPARDLVAAGYAVWIMDAAGQGGSGRYARPHDLGHAPDFRAEGRGLSVMTRVIGRPAVLIAQSTAAPTALTALSAGLRVRAAVLSAPVLDAAEPPLNAGDSAQAASVMDRVKLGWIRAGGQDGWVRAAPLPAGRADDRGGRWGTPIDLSPSFDGAPAVSADLAHETRLLDAPMGTSPELIPYCRPIVHDTASLVAATPEMTAPASSTHEPRRTGT